MILTYDAVDANGKKSHDSIEADNSGDAVDQLRRRGLFVTEMHESVRRGASNHAGAQQPKPKRLPLKTLVMFTRQMSMLLRSGSGLVPAIAAIQRQMRNASHQAVLGEVIAELEDGSSMTDALRRHPRSFDAVYCAIVAAGEASGSLVEMFDRLSHIVQKRRALRKKILGAMAYPSLLIVMCFKILLVMLLFVLPRFNVMFTELGVETPATTQIMLTMGAFLQDHWMILLSAVVGLGVATGFALSKPAGKQWLADMQLYVPAFGWLRSRLIQGQIFRTLGMLLSSGVGLLESLDLVRHSTRNRRYQTLFDRLEQSVTSGGRLSTAFDQSGLVDASIGQAIHTGEESGHLAGAITFCADTLDETNEELVTAVTRLIEPIILIGMGLVVGGVAISLFLPLFDMTSAMR